MLSIGRSPTTICAWPDSTGATRAGMDDAAVLIVGVGVDDHVGTAPEGTRPTR